MLEPVTPLYQHHRRPPLAHIATLAANRRPGYSAKDYLTESILRPDAFKPTGFENSQMDASLAKSLTSEELEDILSFLLVLR
ncbi:MAG: hypothetical protein R2865_11745 [Deinococcales bacterium]